MIASLMLSLRKVLTNLSLLLIGTFSALAIVEGLTRIFIAPPENINVVKVDGIPHGNQQSCCQYNPWVGYYGVPLKSTPKFVHNSLGLRTGEISDIKPAGTERVLLLGDSQTWGLNVTDQQTISAYMKHLGREANLSLEPIPLAQIGYSTDQQLLLLLLIGKKLKPDYVVLVVFEDNDFNEIMTDNPFGGFKPRFIFHKSKFCLSGVPVPMARGWSQPQLGAILRMTNPDQSDSTNLFSSVLQHSRFVSFILNQRLSFWLGKTLEKLGLWNHHDPSNLAHDRDILRRELDCILEGEKVTGERTTPWQVFEKLFLLIKKETDELRVPLILAVKPHQLKYLEGSVGPYYQQLLDLAARTHTPFVDVSSLAKQKGISNEDLFFPRDAHFKPRGNELIAEGIISNILSLRQQRANDE
jgi:hypothetical protein